MSQSDPHDASEKQGTTKGAALQMLAPIGDAGGGVVRRLLSLAIDGNGMMPGARKAASSALAKHADHEEAIEALIRQHVALAGAQGFVTNLGGLVSLPVMLPANMTGAAIVHLRLVACITHLRGYDVDDPRVRSAIMLALVGPSVPLARLAGQNLPTNPLVVATAPVFNAELDERISKLVLAEMAALIGGRKVATLVARRIPVIGGGVSAALDGWSTWNLGRFASDCFVPRRRLTHD